MQTYEDEKLLATTMGKPKELGEVLEEQQSKMRVTHAVIGKIPSKGDVITVNGLNYKVKTANVIDGTFKAKILKPK